VELHARIRRVDLQIERRCLGGRLLFAGQLCEAVGERVSNAEVRWSTLNIFIASSPS
jgi:hypothetical protein